MSETASTKTPSTKPPRTPIVPPERRAGTYESDEDVIGLLWYGTHVILSVPREPKRTTAGTARDCNLVLKGEGISGHHFTMERRAGGLVVSDASSTNGLAHEVRRDLGLALKASFEDQRSTEPFLLVPGMTFVVGAEGYRFIALDEAMCAGHSRLVEILGREDEVRSATESGETPSPSDLILAADSPGHLLITGERGCGQNELAGIIHRISKRRDQPYIEIQIDDVPEDRRRQGVIFKQKATKGTLVLYLGSNRKRFDPAFVSGLFSPAYQIRVIVVARTANQARRVLGHQHWRPLMHIALSPMARRQAAISRLLDEHLVACGSALRFADLSSYSQRALLSNRWHENLEGVRETARRLNALVLSGFSRPKAAEALSMVRQTFYNWYSNTMRLGKTLVSEERKQALLSAVAARAPAS